MRIEGEGHSLSGKSQRIPGQSGKGRYNCMVLQQKLETKTKDDEVQTVVRDYKEETHVRVYS